MTEYYKEKLEQGLEYQDFVSELLLKEIGLAVTTYASQVYQKRKGENLQGVEIKFDDKYKDTGNIYIETAEKSNPDNPNYVSSGIYRNDNTWLYVIGNYQKMFIYSKKFLVLLHKSKRYREVETPTSRGMLLDSETAEKYCIRIIEVA